MGIISSLIKLGIKKSLYGDFVKCKKCKEKMMVELEKLYLLPIRFGDVHEEEASYYIRNGQLIHSLDEIPTGRRAFYLRVVRCPVCGERKVSITDFLQVRDTSTVKAGALYDYIEFEGFINQ